LYLIILSLWLNIHNKCLAIELLIHDLYINGITLHILLDLWLHLAGGAECQVVAVGVPVDEGLGRESMDLSWGINSSIHLDRAAEGSCFRGGVSGRGDERHAVQSSLRFFHVSSDQRFDLGHLKGAIIVVEALGSVSDGGGEIVEGFELPESPGSERIVTDFSDLVDLSGAVVGVKTGSKLRDDKWDA
jgi:hypothetical protein